MNNQADEAFAKGIFLEKKAEFEKAKAVYADMLKYVTDEDILKKASSRMEDMDDLIAERQLYERIDENAKQVLTETGMNIAGTLTIMDILLEADAVDFDKETAPLIPLKRDYIDHCLEQTPRRISADPGLNTFGTGSTSPFLKRAGDEELRPANREEYGKIIRAVDDNQDVLGIFSLPVACDRSISLIEAAKLMEKNYQGIKMIPTNTMSDAEVAFFKDKENWIDGTSLISTLTPMNNMVEPFMRSALAGNNLLLIDQSIAGVSGAASPESFLTQIHAQVLFMIVIAQTLNPGVTCIHCGIPSLAEAGGNLSYSSPCQTLINAALARVNTWITGLPSAQTGGSTSLTELTTQAVADSELSRNALRKYGVHIVRHAMGALGSLNFFSIEKFIEDCERERNSKKIFKTVSKDAGVIPMYFPADDQALAGINEIVEKSSPKNTDHTLKNVDSFRQWEGVVRQAAKRKTYYPELNDIIIDRIRSDA
ncbi:trimethylamine--corrinoid methyltransferase [Dethiosulfatarculus sandiegensis]|uniref:Trimethylamine:corrinoid methyltransferase n=1 Tax=Dethiosulfatarculus sandiegensis TaxID=1429043 RepID=A0A0D2J4R0_9BACT|nr:trimethylamine--corrinoid methyltransferase [Dethiosulfatarculus sandiegensis]KIX13114.1 trimethylamine:corrinoid methyltransferase [Dethiosulfatarculus sandiegensis]